MKSRRLRVVYIACSKYDDEGYVLRFWRGVLPSNTLGCLKTLTEDLGRSHALGPDVDLSVEVYDDTIQRVPVRKLARANRRRDTQVLVGLSGVQSNQFARAMDLALQFRAAGIQVMIGGFHVSGTLATFGEPTRELQRLLDHGVTLVKGEVEGPGVLEGILRDALAGAMKPLYDITPPPDLARAPITKPDREYSRRFSGWNWATLDTSRGCPLNCSYCTIIQVQGRRMRTRSPKCILEQVVRNLDEGTDHYFFTDDNFYRNPIWEELFDGLIALRKRGKGVQFMIQVDTKAYRNARFVEKAAAAGCMMVFTGMESVNPDNLKAANKNVNNPDEYARMVQTWRDAGVLVHGAYIIGFPFDTRESLRRDIAVLRDQIKVDKVSFFMLTPLPGSRDYRKLIDDQTPLDADLNNFDGLHEAFGHPRMAPGEWVAAHAEAWQTFYTKENIVDSLLRVPQQHYWQLF